MGVIFFLSIFSCYIFRRESEAGQEWRALLDEYNEIKCVLVTRGKERCVARRRSDQFQLEIFVVL